MHNQGPELALAMSQMRVNKVRWLATELETVRLFETKSMQRHVNCSLRKTFLHLNGNFAISFFPCGTACGDTPKWKDEEGNHVVLSC